MAVPVKNLVFEKIKNSKSITDVDLAKALAKDDITVPEDRLNKLLLDLEILGLVSVSWLTKDTRRIELVVVKREDDDVDEQAKEMDERDYEASFPGAENDA